MSKKPGLSIQQHKEIGNEIKDIYESLIKLSVELSKAYPFSGPLSRPYNSINKAVEAIIKAKHFAEENLFKEHPEEASAHIYYGPK